MRIELNKKRVTRNRRLATITFLLTLGVLVAGFIVINLPLFTGELPSNFFVLLQLILVPLAFLLTVTSVRLTNNWARQPYPDEAINEGLKGISKKSVVYHFYHAPAEHVLIAPQGVFAIVTRWHKGYHTNQGSDWRTKRSALGRVANIIRMDGIGNPTQDAQRAASHVEKLLNKIVPDAEIDVTPLVVFLDPKAELELEDPEVEVLYASDKSEPSLTAYMRELNRQQKENMQEKARLPLSDEQIAAFEAQTLR
ncbi:MAG: hypothetical protein KC496_10490 [Anaerolineae bacterium]|nr:hypothetical protein [Anaerolineae bacterium]